MWVKAALSNRCQTCLCFSNGDSLSFQGGYTPLNLAVSKQHEEMLECLLKKAADGHTVEQYER